MNEEWIKLGDVILGCALLNEKACIAVADQVDDDMLVRPQQRRVLEQVKQLSRKGDAVDFTTVANALSGEVSAGTIAAMTEAPVVVSNYQTYIEQLRAFRYKHLAGVVARKLASLDGQRIDELRNAAEKATSELVEGSSNDLGLHSLGDTLTEWANRDPSKQWRIPFPWPTLNQKRYGGGIYCNDIVVLGGYSGSGKSWAGIQIAAEAAKKNKRVMYVTIEMDRVRLADRMVRQQGASPADDVFGTFDDKSADIVDTVSKWPVTLFENEMVSWENIRSRYAYLKMRGEAPDVIVIDHLHILEIEDSAMGYRLALDKVLRRMRGFVNRENVALVLLAQFSRPGGGGEIVMESEDGSRPVKRHTKYPMPTKMSLKESGGIEQIANTILLLWRVPDLQDRQSKDTRIIHEKARDNEEAGPIPALWRDDRLAFVELGRG